MNRASRKTTNARLNAVLKMAILQSRYRTARGVSFATRIGETRLSAIVRGRIAPNEGEQKAIARALGLERDELFPVSEAVAS